MANPRQRRKAKSSTHRPVSHSKRSKRLQRKMPTIRGPKALQEAWDRSKTLRQNYLAMGLQHDLKAVSSGGTEVSLTKTTPISSQSAVSEEATSSSALPKGFGRIIRDASGNVVRVELPSDEAQAHESMIDTPIPLTSSELQMWARDHTGAVPGSIASTVVQGQHRLVIFHSRDMVSPTMPHSRNILFSLGLQKIQQLTDGPVDLENLAASATVRERYTSLGERSYLERLVEKYGEDLGKMARDHRLNPDQRTANELRRAIAKAGGYGALCKNTVAG